MTKTAWEHVVSWAGILCLGAAALWYVREPKPPAPPTNMKADMGEPYKSTILYNPLHDGGSNMIMDNVIWDHDGRIYQAEPISQLRTIARQRHLSWKITCMELESDDEAYLARAYSTRESFDQDVYWYAFGKSQQDAAMKIVQILDGPPNMNRPALTVKKAKRQCLPEISGGPEK